MIYLDNNASTRILPEVVESMLPFYNDLWANPSSLHRFGAVILPHMDKAREKVARLIGAARPSEITFTSSGTESNNLAIRGILGAQPGKKHIVTTTVEHSSVFKLCGQLEKEGFEVTYLKVTPEGELDLKELEKNLRSDTALAAIMWANNETGVLFPIETIAKICVAKEVPLHVDAIQAVGKIPIDLRRIPGIRLLSISGHKIHAPKGIGALYCRRGTTIKPQILGGSQEGNRRAGTENVAQIVGLGRACELAELHLQKEYVENIERLRNRLEENLMKKFPWIKRNGNSHRVPNTSNLSFVGCDAEAVTLLMSEEDVCLSTGSACSAGTMGPSRIMTAMGLPPQQAMGTLRISLSFETTEAEIEQAIQAFEKVIARVKK